MAKGKFEYWLTPEGLLKLEAWARDGLIDEQIAENAGITPSTLYEWKKKYPDISEALKREKRLLTSRLRMHCLREHLDIHTRKPRQKKRPMEIRSQSRSRRLYQIPLHRYSGLRTEGQISGGISRTLSTVDR